MCRDIDALIDNAQATLEAMNDDDFVSFIWFSSPGEYRTLVKGARKSDNLSKLLDTLRSTLNTTCFSDPLKDIEIIVNELSAMCPNISVTFFSDGDPVVPWGIEEEKRRVFASLNKLKDKIIAVNTIGYGHGYNQDFLRDMAATTEYGVFVHSKEIEDYKTVFAKNYEILSGTVSEPLDIQTDSAKIVYLSKGFTKMTDNTLNMTRLSNSQGNNSIYLLIKDDANVTVNGKAINTASIKNEIDNKDKETFLYAYAYNLFYNGNRQSCLDVLAKNIKDKNLVDKQMSVFTFDDAANYIQELEQALYNDAARFKDGKCPTNYLPKNNAHCVMDVIMTLAENNAYYLPVHSEAPSYERTTAAKTEKESYFKKGKRVTITSFDNFVFAEDRMNLSIAFKLNGVIQLNSKSAKRVGLPEEFPSFIYQTYTIIKDGRLHTKKLVAAMSNEIYKSLEKAGTKITKLDLDPDTAAALVSEGSNAANYVLALIDLSTLPITNRTYLNKGADISKIFEICNRMVKDEAMQKWINHYIKEIKTLEPEKEGVFRAYTDEQILVLEEHGLSKDGAYRPQTEKSTQASPTQIVEVKSLSFTFKGVSNLPSINEVKKRIAAKGKTTLVLQIMIEAYEELVKNVKSAGQDLDKLSIELKDVLEKELKTIKSRLRTNRYWLGGMKIAKVLTGDWFDGLTHADEKGNYVYEQDDKVLLVKPENIQEKI